MAEAQQRCARRPPARCASPCALRGAGGPTATVAARDGAVLAYERFSPPGRPAPAAAASSAAPAASAPVRGRVLLIPGAAATARQLAPVALLLAAEGYEAVAFDHRGVGASRAATAAAAVAAQSGGAAGSGGGGFGGGRQTSQQLAADALRVADAAWGSDAPLHVFG